MGGISKDREVFFDFDPTEILSSFMVYCQLMNGVLNNANALEKAKNNAQAKSRFLANLSHEIRTPMNAITGMVQLAARSEDSLEIKKYIRQIDNSTQHLLRMLNEVLDIAKIDEGKFSLAYEVFNLQKITNELVQTIKPGAIEKKQRFLVDSSNIPDLNLIGDPVRLSQVLLNLLSNAVKFTPEGGEVRLNIEEIGHDGDKILLKFTVTDTGIGIAAEALHRLFTPFEQESESISRSYGGTGLGLAVSQRIIELMGGAIKVSSVVGQGSTFYFHLRFEMAQGADKALLENVDGDPEEAPDFSAYRVLIVDDIRVNRLVAVGLLKNTQIMHEEAENGQQAVKMFMDSEPGYYDCILMDVRMPVLDGVAATRVIRAADRPDASRVIILAMTANVFTEDVKEVLEAGMDGYIAKPVEYKNLIKTLRRLLNKRL